MKKLAINVFVNGINYTSDYNEYDEKQEQTLLNLVDSITSGKSINLFITSDNKRYYFPAKLLEISIISIVQKK